MWVPVETANENDVGWASFKACVNMNHSFNWIFAEIVMSVELYGYNHTIIDIENDNTQLVTTLFEKPMTLYL